MDKLPDDCLEIILRLCEDNENAIFLAMCCRVFYQLALKCRLDLRFYFKYCMMYDALAVSLFKYGRHYTKKSMIDIWIMDQKAQNLLDIGKYTFSDVHIIYMPNQILDKYVNNTNLDRLLEKAKNDGCGQFISWYVRRQNYNFGNINIFHYNNVDQDVYDAYIEKTTHKLLMHQWRDCQLPDKNKHLHRVQDALEYYKEIFSMTIEQIEANIDEHPMNYALFAINENRPDIMVVFLRNLEPKTIICWNYSVVHFLMTTDNDNILREIGENFSQAGIELILEYVFRTGNYRNFDIFRKYLKKPISSLGRPTVGNNTPLEVMLLLENEYRVSFMRYCSDIEILNHIEVDDPIKVFTYQASYHNSSITLLREFVKKFIPCGIKQYVGFRIVDHDPEKINFLIDVISSKEWHMSILLQIILVKKYDKITFRILSMYDELPIDILRVVCSKSNWIKYRALRKYFTIEQRLAEAVRYSSMYILQQELHVFTYKAIWYAARSYHFDYELKRLRASLSNSVS